MRTDHNSLADLITAANARQIEPGGDTAFLRAWWAMIARVAVCAVSSYMIFAALAVAADYFDLIGP